MDSGHLNNPTHPSHGNDTNIDFLSGIQSYTDSSDPNDVLHQFFDPELFQSQDYNNGVQSQSQPQSQQQPQRQSQSHQTAYPSSTSGQQSIGRSQSPAMSAFNPSQPYSQHQSYSQPLYDQRSMFNQQYDPRIYQRPSHSPAPFEQYSYQGQYGGQSYPGQMNIQPRPQQSTPSYTPTQQSWNQFQTYNSRNPTLPQSYDADLGQFANISNRSSSQPYGNPPMLDGTFKYPPAQPQKPQQGQSSFYYHTPSTSAGSYQPQMQQAQQGTQQGFQQSIQQQSQTNRPAVPQMGMIPQSMQQNISIDVPVSNLPMKKARGRPRKDASKPGSVTTDSGSDLEIEDEPPEPPPAVIAVAPPTDARAKVVFDAVAAVWSPRNKAAETAKIKSGITQFGGMIRAWRDQWKTRNDNLKKAEADQSPTAQDAPALRQESSQYRQTMELLVNRTLNFGHPAILKSLGEIPYTLSALYSFMLDRVSAADYDSSLLLAILRLAEKFTTVDEEKLETSKWNKLLQRVAKKGSNEGKALAEKILSNAKKQTARKAEAPKPDISGSGDLAAGIKRAREGEVNGPVPKKMVRASSKPLAVQALEKRKAAEEAAKKAKAAAPAATLITPAAAKPKPLIKATTTTPFALKSASKKPGTTNAEREQAALGQIKDGSNPALQQVKREPVKRESPPASIAVPATSSSLFSSLFSSIDKKEEVKPKEEEIIPGETPEQKSKRLRKESRRKLRVSWKNDNDLEEVRFFTHDPDEEMNQGDSAKRDAGDTGKEGEMLKKHQGMEDLDDDDEEEADDPDYDPDCYSPPTEVDLDGLASEDLDPNESGVKSGGKLVPESKSREAQDTFEKGVLMVFYSEVDRPDSPKEPPDDSEDDFAPSADFGAPDEEVRKREQNVYAHRNTQSMQLDGGSNNPAFQSISAFTGQSSQSSNASDILASLSNLRTTAQPAPQSQQTSSVDIQSIIAQLQKTQQPTQPANPFAPPPQPTYTPQPDPNALASLIAKFTQPQAGNTGFAPPPMLPNFGFSTGANAIGATTEDYGSGESTANGKRSGKNSGGKSSKATGRVPIDENGLPLNYKTLTCQFWEKGKCTKGDSCTFKHSR